MSSKPSLHFCKTGSLACGERFDQNLHQYSKELRIEECKKYHPEEMRTRLDGGGGRKKYKRHKSRKRKSRKSRKHRRKSKRHSRR